MTSETQTHDLVIENAMRLCFLLSHSKFLQPGFKNWGELGHPGRSEPQWLSNTQGSILKTVAILENKASRLPRQHHYSGPPVAMSGPPVAHHRQSEGATDGH